jgi:hypothetical protein
MNAAESSSGLANDRADAPSSASDAIEDELYKLEAERLPPTHTRIFGPLRGLVQLAQFIVRPESMTAYATLAAAFAAFLAVKAAERQEKATFTSALFSKQVDLLASVEFKLDAFMTQVAPINRDNLLFGQQFAEQRQQFDPSQSINDAAIESSLNDFLNAISALHMVYPSEADMFVFKIGMNAHQIAGIISQIKTTLNAKLTPGNERDIGYLQDQLDGSYKNLNMSVHDMESDRIGLVSCSLMQLRTSANIDGPAFQRCVSSRKS